MEKNVNHHFPQTSLSVEWEVWIDKQMQTH